MYLIPRLIGVFSYALALIVICFFISISNIKQSKIILRIYIILLSIMGFLFVPPPGSDLYRLLPVMHIFSHVNLKTLWEYMISSSTPVLYLYYKIIGQFNIDGLLAGVTTLIFYCNCFYILYDYSKYENIKSKDIALVLFLFMARGSFGEVIGGIRTMLAFSLIAICSYKELVKKKSVLYHLPIYLIASLLHQAGLALTILRILYLAIQNIRNKRGKSQLILAIALMALGIYYGRNYLVAMSDKAMSYFTRDTYTYIWEMVLGIINISLIIAMIRLNKKKGSNTDLENFTTYMIIIVLICVFFDYNTFHRLEMFTSIISLPIILKSLQDYSLEKTRKDIKFVIIMTSIVLLAIASTRGNLCSLKFFETL